MAQTDKISIPIELKKIGEGFKEIQGEIKEISQVVNREGKEIKRETAGINDGFKNLGATVGSLKNMFVGLIGAAGIGAVVHGFKSLLTSTIDNADQIAKLSTRLGIGTEALSEYQFVADRAGVTFETFTMAIQRMTRRVAEAAAGTGEAKKALQELGMDAAYLNRLEPDQQFELLAGAMVRVTNEADKVRLAMRLFDSEGVAMLQILKQGTEAIKEQREQAKAFGLSLSKDMTKKAEEAKDAITNLKASFKGLGIELAENAIPFLTKVSDLLTTLVRKAKEAPSLGKYVEAKALGFESWEERLAARGMEEFFLGRPKVTRIPPGPSPPTAEELEKAAKARQAAWEKELNYLKQWHEFQERLAKETPLERQLRAIRESGVWMDEYRDDLQRFAKEFVADVREMTEEASSLWADLTKDLKYGLEAGLFDIFKGGIRDFGDAWQQFVNFLREAFARALAKMVSDWIIAMAQMKITSFAGGGGAMGIIGKLLGLLGIGRGAGAGGPVYTAAAGAVHLLQGGGWITEPVYGVGARTGHGYVMGERGPEQVIPAGGAAPNVAINIINKSGIPLETTGLENMRFDGTRYIIDVVMDSYMRKRNFRQAFAR